MTTQKIIELKRDCVVRVVPAGTPKTLPKHTFVTLDNQRGTAFTILYQGNLYWITGKDADAIGFTPFHLDYEMTSSLYLPNIWKTLEHIYDPEIPVNIVDLGLIYHCSIESNTHVRIQMTLTSPTCGMGKLLMAEIEMYLKLVPYVEKIDIELVFHPPWSKEMLSEDALLTLGL